MNTEEIVQRLRDEGHLTQRDGLAALLETCRNAADQLELKKSSPWSQVIRDAWDTGITVEVLTREIGSSAARQALMAAGEYEPSAATQRLMRGAIEEMVVRRAALSTEAPTPADKRLLSLRLVPGGQKDPSPTPKDPAP